MSNPTIHRIEIIFPARVDITDAEMRDLDRITTAICKRYERRNPGRIMWAFGVGSRITSMPMTMEDEEPGVPMTFDESVFEISCAEREDYRWPCSKCGLPQGDHGHCITEPKAGLCEFEPKVNTKPLAQDLRGLLERAPDDWGDWGVVANGADYWRIKALKAVGLVERRLRDGLWQTKLSDAGRVALSDGAASRHEGKLRDEQ